MPIEGRRVILAAIGALSIFAATAPLPVFSQAVAAQEHAMQPFTEAAFDAAQKAGKPILIDTYATWCDICARQAPILDKLIAEPKYRDLVVFRVNFDTQKNVMRQMKAQLQSTLIAYRGSKEVGRSVGETQPEWIEDLLSKTLTNPTT